jgi:hypothetical protein
LQRDSISVLPDCSQSFRSNWFFGSSLAVMMQPSAFMYGFRQPQAGKRGAGKHFPTD